MSWARLVAGLSLLATGCFIAPERPARGDVGDGGSGDAAEECPLVGPLFQDYNTPDQLDPCGLNGEQGANMVATRSFGAVSFPLGPSQNDTCIAGIPLDPTVGAFVVIAEYQPVGAGDEMYLRLEHSAQFVEVVLRNSMLELAFSGTPVGTPIAYDGTQNWWRLVRGATQNSVAGQYSTDGKVWKSLGEKTDPSIDNTSGLLTFGAATDDFLNNRLFSFDSFNTCP
jgi:hypothetical protein